MALPTTGQITLAQIAAEFGGATPYYLSQFYRGGGRVTTNNTSVPTSGQIFLSQFRGAAKAVAGGQNFTVPGTYNFTIPVHQTITIYVDGAGGGGGDMGVNYGFGIQNSGYGNGQAGGYSAFSGFIVAYGGSGGSSWPGGAGAGGTATGGNTQNLVGGGAGYGGAGSCYIGYCGGAGGHGGRCLSIYNAGTLTPGSVVTITVGTGGSGTGSPFTGAKGTNGAVYISWT